ncbi:hypothetical protein MRB53_040962 [Persea americana]|nr:hypothetical protein MRB53_040962 [Persea americana]
MQRMKSPTRQQKTHCPRSRATRASDSNPSQHSTFSRTGHENGVHIVPCSVAFCSCSIHGIACRDLPGDALTANRGLVNAFGSFASYYKVHLMNTTSVQLLDLIGSLQCFLILVASGITGRLIDAGYYRYLSVCRLRTHLARHVHAVSLRRKRTVRPRHILAGGPCSGCLRRPWHGLLLRHGIACCCVVVSAKADLRDCILLCWRKRCRLPIPRAVQYVSILVCGISALTLVTAIPNPAAPVRKPSSWFRLRVWVDTQAFKNAAYRCYVIAFHHIGVAEDRRTGTGGRQGSGGFRTFWLLAIMSFAFWCGACRVRVACAAARFVSTSMRHSLSWAVCSCSASGCSSTRWHRRWSLHRLRHRRWRDAGSATGMYRGAAPRARAEAIGTVDGHDVYVRGAVRAVWTRGRRHACHEGIEHGVGYRYLMAYCGTCFGLMAGFIALARFMLHRKGVWPLSRVPTGTMTPPTRFVPDV